LGLNNQQCSSEVQAKLYCFDDRKQFPIFDPAEEDVLKAVTFSTALLVFLGRRE
jgi:hypothetical protein